MSTIRRWRLILAHLTLVMTCIVMLITSRSVAGGGTTGDFPLFVQAGHALIAGEPLHAADRGYIYGPFPALLFAVLSPLGRAGAAWALAVFNAAALWFCVTFGARAALRAFAIRRDALLDAEVALIGLLLSLDKARSVINGGQTDLLVLLPLVLALAWNGTRPTGAGVALGFAANIKYTTLVLFPYLAWRRQWRACAAMIVSGLGFALAPALACGWQQNLDHWRTSLTGLGRLIGAEPPSANAAPFGAITFEQSISITSAVSRWLIQDWGRPVSGLVVIAVALAVLGACSLLYRHHRIPMLMRGKAGLDEPVLRYIEWTGLIAALLAFSPQTQGRHFVMLLPLYLGAGVMLRKPRVPRPMLFLGLVVIQAGLILPPAGLANYEHAVQSWRTIGGARWCLLILFLCYLNAGLRTARAVRDSPGEGGAPPFTFAGTAVPDRGS